jgi:hypothetical protein
MGADDFRSTMPVSEPCGKTLPSEAEVMGAVNERLKFWTDDQIRAGLRLLLDLQILGIPIDEEAAFELDQPADRREPWTALCAIGVLHARAAGDVALFWRAGAVVLGSAARSKSAREPRSGALSELMESFATNHPDAVAQDFCQHVAEIAGSVWPVCSFDEALEVLEIEDEYGRIRSLKMDSVRRQFDRFMKRRMAFCAVP